MTVAWFWVVVPLAALTLAGCTGGERTITTGKEHPFEGGVLAVDQNKPSVKLDHEEIPGLMKAMEMDYAVENANVLEGIKAGDLVQGQLRAASGKHTITRLEKR